MKHRSQTGYHGALGVPAFQRLRQENLVIQGHLGLQSKALSHLLKCLPTSLRPELGPSTHIKARCSGACVKLQCWGHGDRWIPGACPPACQAILVSSKFSDRFCIKKKVSWARKVAQELSSFLSEDQVSDPTLHIRLLTLCIALVSGNPKLSSGLCRYLHTCSM